MTNRPASDWMIGICVYLLVVVGFPTCVILLLNRLSDPQPYYVPVLAALFLALITPFSVIAIRTQVRITRIRMIELFETVFGIGEKPKPARGVPEDAAAPDKCTAAVLSFEFVKGKYFIDIPRERGTNPTIADVPQFPMLLLSDWMILFCAVPYIIFSGFGLFLLLAPDFAFDAKAAIGQWLPPDILGVGGAGTKVTSEPAVREAYFHNTVTVASMAFAGAYFFTLRLFLRAVVVFDLSAVTFLRAFAHMVLSVILAVVIYRVLPSFDDVANLADLQQTGLAAVVDAKSTARAGVTNLWLFLAFALGFVPESGLAYVLGKSGIAFKQRYTELEVYTKIIPLTLIDGIDHMIAFRLEEANIFDVQNLATFNPIMLHVESPYGIFTTIDWVAQAQLCTVVGAERFLALKTLNIRTIFDLRRAVLGSKAATPAPLLIDSLGDLLLQDDRRDAKFRADLGFTRLPAAQISTAAPGPAEIAARREALRALVEVILDDLHVRRLDQIWLHIERQLAPPYCK